jgi:ATP-binding cassette subfamily C protein
MLQVYDRVVPTRGEATLAGLTAALVFALATLSILDAVRARLFTLVGIRLNRQLAGVILNAAYSERGKADAATRQVMREFDTLRQALTGPAALAVFDLPWMPVYILVCFLLNPALGGVVLLGGALLASLAWLNDKATKTPLMQATEASNRAYVNQDQGAAAADVVRALGMRQAMVNRNLIERQTAANLQTQAVFVNGNFAALSKFARLALQSTALGVGAWLAIHDEISAGTIFAASFLVARAMAPLDQILGTWKSISQARIAWRTVSTFLETSAASKDQVTRLPALAGRLELDRLTIQSPAADRLLVQGVSCQIGPGEVVAIIGPSGAGKSTLLRAMAGASDYMGAVRFDGAEMKDYDPERLGRWLGYAPQETALFAGTVKDNISRFAAYDDAGPEDIDEQVIAAAKACGAHEMIVRLPAGYDTVLGWGGRGLSAGQAQRVALARALYGSPRILMLDEPDAHLDAEGETTLAMTLKSLKARGKTVVIVSHRPGALSAADRLMVIRDGRLDVMGPRDEVLERLSRPAPSPAAAAPQPVSLRA